MLHAPKYKVYNNYWDASLPPGLRERYTTGWDEDYVGKGGDEVVKVLENRQRLNQQEKMTPARPRYKSKNSHDAALYTNPWTRGSKDMHSFIN